MRAAVLGHPVAHSLSPVLHGAAYRELGLTGWRYDAVELESASLAEFVEGMDDDWAGLSLTMPLKQIVLPLLDTVSSLATAVGVANTVTFGGPTSDGRRERRGDNTDVAGIVTALAEAGVTRVGSGCVLGGGATAASAVAALAGLGCRAPRVHVRSTARAGVVTAAAARLGVDVHLLGFDRAADALSADLVVSTVPGDGAAGLAAAVADAGAGRAMPVLLDVVYAPWPTALARAWEARGGQVVGGFEMLLHQAAAQVRMMTGRDAPVEAMRAAGLAALAVRA